MPKRSRGPDPIDLESITGIVESLPSASDVEASIQESQERLEKEIEKFEDLVRNATSNIDSYVKLARRKAEEWNDEFLDGYLDISAIGFISALAVSTGLTWLMNNIWMFSSKHKNVALPLIFLAVFVVAITTLRRDVQKEMKEIELSYEAASRVFNDLKRMYLESDIHKMVHTGVADSDGRRSKRRLVVTGEQRFDTALRERIEKLNKKLTELEGQLQEQRAFLDKTLG